MTAKKEPLRLRIVTYNIHKCRGIDGRTHPERIAAVLERLKPDIVALQEVIGAGPKRKGQEEEIGDRLGMACVLAPARTLRGRPYGNALLTRLPIAFHGSYDLTQQGLEPRFLQRVDLDLQGHRIHFFNAHLGTSQRERSLQAGRLISHLWDPAVRGTRILLGDFNEWRKGPATALLAESLQSLDLLPFLRWRRTYPGILPLFHIDHIYYRGKVEILKVEVPRRWSALIASDHMPISVELRILI
ncbi:MAG: endonuclease/exonuclease/phosphatase family protein [Syntrophaceae bacterium]|nr:endonuclease/exonuclease/phosphatase family protein [Syntrophaceae bacterium]